VPKHERARVVCGVETCEFKDWFRLWWSSRFRIVALGLGPAMPTWLPSIELNTLAKYITTCTRA
jgi:hypothetical protein